MQCTSRKSSNKHPLEWAPLPSNESVIAAVRSSKTVLKMHAIEHWLVITNMMIDFYLPPSRYFSPFIYNFISNNSKKFPHFRGVEKISPPGAYWRIYGMLNSFRFPYVLLKWSPITIFIHVYDMFSCFSGFIYIVLSWTGQNSWPVSAYAVGDTMGDID